MTDDVHGAVNGIDFVYTDVWVSMGESDDAVGEPRAAAAALPGDAEVMARSGKGSTRVHALPARVHDSRHRVGQRVHERFGIDGARSHRRRLRVRASVVFDQAENRLHTIKALMVDALAD